MKRLDQPGVTDELIQRLSRLAPDTVRQWGTMTPHEMMCHVTDSYQIATGGRVASRADTLVSRTIVRAIALHTSLRWPPGVPTRPEVDPTRQGTRPLDFERDRRALIDELSAFARPRERYGEHPFFGALTRREWMIWGYKHFDHHLRQFGL
jgi:hypothetical protein